MRRGYVALAGAMTLLVAAACSDKLRLTETGRGLAPRGASHLSAAGFTTINGTGDCLNGPGVVNCNIYDSKDAVWMNGGPVSAALGDGDYFFAVVSPGGNPDPNDGAQKLLSEDLHDNRTFHIDGGVVSYSGTHLPDLPKIQLSPYNDTPNNGGVYIMAICSLKDGYPVDPKSCKYDAFKIQSADCIPETDPFHCGPPVEASLDISKTLNTTFTRTYAWTVTKSSDVSTISLAPGQSTTIHYTVGVQHNSGTDGSYAYNGTITVTNTGSVDAHNVTVTDPTVTLGSCTPALPVATLAPNGTITCSYSKSVSTPDPVSNVATATWDGLIGPVSVQVDPPVTGAFTTPTTLADNCVTVKDQNAPTPTLGTVCVGDPEPFTFTYNKLVTAPTGTGKCGTTFNVDNDAIATANTSGTQTDKTNRVVGTVVCGCTLGYWKNNDIYDWKVVTKPSTYGFAALSGGANGGTGDWFWKGTVAAPAYSWPNGAPSTYRTASSKLNQAQAFGTTALGNASYSALAGLGFYQALSLPGGTDFVGKAQNLLRQATAGLLNATWTDGTHTIAYPLTASALITAVNTALLTKDAATIDNLQKQLAGYNQGGTQDLANNNACPLNAAGAWYPH